MPSPPPGESPSADPPVCARCAAGGQSCCQITPGNEENCFPLSEMERGRILEAAPGRGGFSLSPNSAAFLDNLRRLFPGDRREVSRMFPPGKEHTRLSVTPEGDCAFLSPDGCILPNQARPYYCRLFPFWRIDGELTVFAAKNCLAVKQGETVPRIMHLIGTSPRQIASLHGRLRLAWGLTPESGGAGPDRTP